MLDKILENIVKNIDVESLMVKALADPRIAELLVLAKSVHSEFQAISKKQDAIIARLDKIEMHALNADADIAPLAYFGAGALPEEAYTINPEKDETHE